MTLLVQQDPITRIWTFDAVGSFSQTNFHEEYSNIIQNYAGADIIKILVDLRAAKLPMDYDTLIKALIAFMDDSTPVKQLVNMMFVVRNEQNLFNIQRIKIDGNLRVAAHPDREVVMAWLRM